jgi:hypothetical protein
MNVRRVGRERIMRVYLWVVLMIFGLMGAYLALVPIAVSPDSNRTASSTGPF